MKKERKPHSFCETPEEKCTMNYCDDNGCQNRVRNLVKPRELTPESFIQDIATHLGKTIPETLDHIEKFAEDLEKLKNKQKKQRKKL